MPSAVVPALLLSLQDEDSSVRWGSVISLGRLRQYPETVVPALLNYIQTETNMPVSTVIITLARFGTNARLWSPTLVQMMESNRFGIYYPSALMALKNIDPETAEPLNR